MARNPTVKRSPEFNFREVFFHAPVGMAAVDLEGHFVQVNPAFCNLLGYSERELLSGAVTFRDVTDPHDLDAVWSRIEQLVAGKIRVLSIDKRCLHKGGEIVNTHVTANPWRNAQGEVLGIIGTVEDIRERMRHEAELSEMAEQRRMALDAASLGWWNLDVASNQLSSDERARAITGFERETLDLHEILRQILPEDRDAVNKIIRRAASGPIGSVYAAEFRFKRENDGRVVWLATRKRTYSDSPIEPKRVTRFVGTVEDITDRKEAEKALRESEARFRQLAESMPQHVWTADPDGTVDYYSEGHKEYTGLVRKPEGGFDWAPAVHEEDLQRTQAAFAHSIKTGERFQIEHRIRMADGSHHWHISRGLPGRDEQGRIVKWFGTSTDIDEIKRAEEALRLSEEQFRTLANSLPQLVWIADPAGYIYWYSDRWYEFTGTTFEEMKGWGWKKTVHPEHLDRVVQRIKRAWLTGEPWEDTFPMRAKDGGYRWFLSRAVPLRDDEGTIVRWFGTNTDVTVQLEAQNNALERKSTALREVLASIERQKDDLKRQMVADLEYFVMPAVRRLKDTVRGEAQDQIEMIEQSVSDAGTAEFRQALLKVAPSLTAREIKICDLIRQDLPSKQIADMLGVSPATIQKQRDGIRRKLGLTGKDQNLVRYLQTLSGR